MLALRAVPAVPPDEVEVSVVVPAFNAAGTIERCLAALDAQDTSAPYEVIVVDSGTDGTAELVAQRFPDVRVCRFPERKYAGHARNLAIPEARGDLLAFTDADCIPAPGWVEAVWRAHRDPAPVVGGVVDNANPESLVGRAYYYTEFNRWLPDAPGGAIDDVPGCCWSMKRSAYERYGPFVEGTYCSDTAFHWKMAAEGDHPRLDPGIVVAHLNPTDWRRSFAHEAQHGRMFARVRVKEQRMSRAAILMHATTGPLLPFLLFGRAVRNVLAARRHLPAFVRAAPLVFLAMVWWSSGETRGYASALRAP